MVLPQNFPPKGKDTQGPQDFQPETENATNRTYEDMYRTGNFGVLLGKVNSTRAKRWLLVHASCTTLMFLLTITGSSLLKYYIPHPFFKSAILGYTWTASSLGVISAAVGAYFFWRLPMLSRPFALLMIFRLLVVLNWIVNLSFGWVFTIVIVNAGEEMFFGLSKSGIGFLKFTYAVITILMLVECVVSHAFVFHWWNCCSGFPDVCKCCSPWCVYDKGEEIAPGVPNPPSSRYFFLAAQALTPLANIEI